MGTKKSDAFVLFSPVTDSPLCLSQNCDGVIMNGILLRLQCFLYNFSCYLINKSAGIKWLLLLLIIHWRCWLMSWCPIFGSLDECSCICFFPLLLLMVFIFWYYFIPNILFFTCKSIDESFPLLFLLSSNIYVSKIDKDVFSEIFHLTWGWFVLLFFESSLHGWISARLHKHWTQEPFDDGLMKDVLIRYKECFFVWLLIVFVFTWFEFPLSNIMSIFYVRCIFLPFLSANVKQ